MAPFPPPPLAPPADEPCIEWLPLVAVIELKWLAAGVGQHLHVERMQHDPIYARQVLAAAEAGPHSALRRTAQRLRRLLDDRAGPGATADRQTP